jgi:hypothetical protein
VRAIGETRLRWLLCLVAAAVLGSAACTSDDDGGDGSSTGVLQVSDLAGEGWAEVDEPGHGTLCGELSSMIDSMSDVAGAAEVTYERDGVIVVSESWIEAPGSGTRRAAVGPITAPAIRSSPRPVG